MPFRSQAQWRWAHAAEARGELPPGTARRWAHETRAPYWELPTKLHGFDADQVVVQPPMQQDSSLWKTLLVTAATAVVSTMVTFWMMDWLEKKRRR